MSHQRRTPTPLSTHEQDMKIYDLTRGKYPKLYAPTAIEDYKGNIEAAYYDCARFADLFSKPHKDVDAALGDIPIFLVESSMSGEYVMVPGQSCIVSIPKDRYISETEPEELERRKQDEEDEKKDDPRERTSQPAEVTDLLGVYVYLGEDALIPRRIFIWMDKIVACATKHTKIHSSKDIDRNSVALYDFVVCHELAHAMMDVELHGMCPCPNFSYRRDFAYRFFEEAYANAIALHIAYEKFDSPQKSFIHSFINQQPAGYSYGWDLYDAGIMNAEQWMSIKVLFNASHAHMLKAFWRHKDFSELQCVEPVNRKGRIASRFIYRAWPTRWVVLNTKTLQKVPGFKFYDSYWSFGKEGLCMVRKDIPGGFLYGFVNEEGHEQIPVEYDYLYNFENGITIAKKDGKYGVIDTNNNIVIPFGLPYAEVRGFRDGRAAVKDHHGKWGVIDTKGNLIVPCTSDDFVL